MAILLRKATWRLRIQIFSGSHRVPFHNLRSESLALFFAADIINSSVHYHGDHHSSDKPRNHLCCSPLPFCYLIGLFFLLPLKVAGNRIALQQSRRQRPLTIGSHMGGAVILPVLNTPLSSGNKELLHSLIFSAHSSDQDLTCIIYCYRSSINRS